MTGVRARPSTVVVTSSPPMALLTALSASEGHVVLDEASLQTDVRATPRGLAQLIDVQQIGAAGNVEGGLVVVYLRLA